MTTNISESYKDMRKTSILLRSNNSEMWTYHKQGTCIFSINLTAMIKDEQLQLQQVFCILEEECEKRSIEYVFLAKQDNFLKTFSKLYFMQIGNLTLNKLKIFLYDPPVIVKDLNEQLNIIKGNHEVIKCKQTTLTKEIC